MVGYLFLYTALLEQAVKILVQSSADVLCFCGTCLPQLSEELVLPGGDEYAQHPGVGLAVAEAAVGVCFIWHGKASWSNIAHLWH